MSSNQHAPVLRSMYRRLLRELPARQPSILSNPSPVQKRIRYQFSSISPTASTSYPTNASPDIAGPGSSTIDIESRMQQVDQYLQYLRGQNTYTTLLERYNPGMNMDEEEKVRLSARRVGMNLPIEVGKKKE